MKKDFWNELGDMYLKANAVDAAIDSYQKAIQQGYQDSEAYINLAGAYMRQGHIVESIQVYQKSLDLLSEISEKAVIYTRIGDCYRQLQDFDNAIQSFRMAIDLEPGNPQLVLGLVKVQQDMEKLYSLEEFEKLPIEAEFSTPRTLNQTTVSESILASADLAEFNSDHEIEPELIIPAESQTSSGCAEIMPPVFVDECLDKVSEDLKFRTQLESPEKVLPFLSENTELEPVLSNLAAVEFEENAVPPLLDADIADQGRQVVDDNLADELLTIKAKPEFCEPGLLESERSAQVTLLLKLGIMYWRNENLDEANRVLLHVIDTAAEIQNSWIEALAWHTMALVKTAMADVIGAIRAYLRAVELAPEQIFPWNNVGNLYSNLGNNDEALNSFHKALCQNPQNSTSWDGLGDIYTRIGRIEDAISAYQLANLFDDRVKSADAIKSYEKAFGFYNFTLDSIQKVVAKNPNENYLDQEQGQPTADTTTNREPEKAVPDLVDSKEDSTDDQENSIELSGDSAESAIEKTVEIFPAILDVVQPANLVIKNQGAASDTQKIVPDVPASVEKVPTLRPTRELHTVSAFQARDRRSVPVVDLYEQFIGGAGSVDNIQPDQPVRGEEAFSAVPEISATGIPADEVQKTVSKSMDDEAPLLEKNEDLFEQVLSAENNLNLMDDPGSTPDVGMLPIVNVNPTPKPEVNRVSVTIATYEATVRENPYNDRAWDSLGNLYRIVQRNKDAIRSFERAVSLEPTKYVYHYQLGTLYASEGNFVKAIREIQTVVDLNPDFTFAHCALASYLRRVGQDDEAERHIAIAVPFMKNEKEYDRACFESIRGNVNGALELLEIALNKKQTTVEWIQRDLDLDFIRNDPRYRVLTGKSSQSVVGYQ